MFTSVLLALSLNFDTFSVAIVEGAESEKPNARDLIRVGLYFGLGQAMMAMTGSVLGTGFKFVITNIDHWIAFILLSGIGIKMIHDIISNKNGHKKIGILRAKTLVPLVIATSIDALVVGITFAFLKEPVIFYITLIGIISFVISIIGFYYGKELRLVFRNKIKIAGGVTLILIGVKILFEHLFFN